MSIGQRTVTVLGSTGSIGESTLDVLAQHPQHFAVHALTASTSVQKMLAQCLQFSPAVAVMACEDSATELESGLRARVVKPAYWLGTRAWLRPQRQLRSTW